MGAWSTPVWRQCYTFDSSTQEAFLNPKRNGVPQRIVRAFLLENPYDARSLYTIELDLTDPSNCEGLMIYATDAANWLFMHNVRRQCFQLLFPAICNWPVIMMQRRWRRTMAARKLDMITMAIDAEASLEPVEDEDTRIQREIEFQAHVSQVFAYRQGEPLIQY